MNVYIFILWLIFINLFFYKVKNKLLLLLVLIPMILSLGSQVGIGIDYYNYIKLFEGDILREFEIGYELYTNFLKLITTNSRILFVGIALLQGIIFGVILLKLYKEKIIKNIPLYVLIYCVITDGYYLMFNTLRSSIASLFFILAILFLIKKEKRECSVLSFFSYSFHKSSLLVNGIFLILLKVFNKKYKKYFFFFFFIICLLLNYIDFIFRIGKILYNSSFEFPYKFYLGTYHMRTYGIIKSGYGIASKINIFIAILCSFSYSVKNYEKSKLKLMLCNMGYFTLGLKILLLNIPILNRPFEYFNVVLALVYYEMIIYLNKKGYNYISVILLLFFVVQFLVSIFRIKNFIV